MASTLPEHLSNMFSFQCVSARRATRRPHADGEYLPQHLDALSHWAAARSTAHALTAYYARRQHDGARLRREWQNSEEYASAQAAHARAVCMGEYRELAGDGSYISPEDTARRRAAEAERTVSQAEALRILAGRHA